HVEKESGHLEYLPEEADVDEALVLKWKNFMAVRDDVFKALEVARNEKVIGKSLEAKVYVTSHEGLDFTDINGSLEQLFIVSQVEVEDAIHDVIVYDNVTFKGDLEEG